MKGTGEIHAELTGMNSARGYRIGKSVIEFNDNTDIQISNPEIKVEGIVVGDRRLNYAKNTIFIDKANGLWGDIIYNLDESGKITKLAGKLKSWWKKETEEKLPSDYLTVKISKYEKLPDGGISKEPLSEGNGSWLEYLQIDGDVLWRINDERELWNAPEILLPSDSRLRDDLQLIKNRDFDKAQVEKERIENLQRADSKLRKENASRKTNGALQTKAKYLMRFELKLSCALLSLHINSNNCEILSCRVLVFLLLVKKTKFHQKARSNIQSSPLRNDLISETDSRTLHNLSLIHI
eukprot:TRINITY_DN1398_c0_g2_i4.p1 TRINITY_DN1398_c0_g2~~TRINITY_DN1398_c0_g2_i4.p1  ORF type:complete len:295 (-),score=53.73 TRINITY_DN1398_c0_g2_i4:62-946(-)